MKHIISIVIVVLLFSCNETQKNEKERIKIFENSLGKYGSMNLNKSVNNFDSFLNEKYKEIESSDRFRRYLKEIADSENPELWEMEIMNSNEINEISENKATITKEDDFQVSFDSTLVAKKLRILPDSVWHEDNVVKSIYSKPIKLTHSNAVPRDEYLKSNIEEVIKTEKEGFVKLMGKDQLKSALKSIMDYDILVKNYFLAKQSDLDKSIQDIAKGLLCDYNPEEKYFAKRIIMLEMND